MKTGRCFYLFIYTAKYLVLWLFYVFFMSFFTFVFLVILLLCFHGLKSQIFITAGERSVACGYENQAHSG
jgi:hypothetical protein